MQDGGEEKEIKFEDALKALERVVEELEKGDLTLDEMLKKLEEGIRLFKICREKLEKAEARIEELSGEI